MSEHYSTYRVNYALRSHKRDAFIEFIKAQLLSPFALHVRPLNLAALAAAGPEATSATVARAAADMASMRDHYLSVFASVERLVAEHMLEQDKRKPESRLATLVPTLGKFFTPLPLARAFLAHDDHTAVSSRRHVPMSFNEIRAVLNTAQVMAIAPEIKLITFDGDMTLYDDGCNFDEDSRLVELLVKLLRFSGLNVAIVTAAGYTEAERYEQRLSGLLNGFKRFNLSADAVGKFWVMGGECNYLFRCKPDYHLERVPLPYAPETYFQHTVARHSSLTNGAAASEVNLAAALTTPPAAAASDSDLPSAVAAKADATPAETQAAVVALLDAAERILKVCAAAMRLPARVIRKERAVGIIAASPTVKLTREQLDECVLSLQHGLASHLRTATHLPRIPFCAFNGGADVWVDIGNKLIGVRMVAEHLGVAAREVAHVGDQFLSTGNDYAARRGCSTLWIASPQETAEALVELIGEMQKSGRSTLA